MRQCRGGSSGGGRSLPVEILRGRDMDFRGTEGKHRFCAQTLHKTKRALYRGLTGKGKNIPSKEST